MLDLELVVVNFLLLNFFRGPISMSLCCGIHVNICNIQTKLEIEKKKVRPCRLLNALNGFIISNLIHVQINLECCYVDWKAILVAFIWSIILECCFAN
jgi:hypothetical protein